MLDESLQNANILIVDDQEANLTLLEAVLEQAGYINLKMVVDSRQVAGLLAEFQPDLILLDLLMPHLDGFAVMAQLRGVVPADDYLPILVLTADITPEAKQRALSGGAKDFLTKPFDVMEVLLRVRNLLETRYLYGQLQRQNEILEEKVIERTVQLRDANVQLRISMRAKEQMVHNVSHEFRTPLVSIKGYAELLAGGMLGDLTAEQAEAMQTIQQASERLHTMIERFLALQAVNIGDANSRLETNLRPWLAEVVWRWEPRTAAAKIRLGLEAAGPIPRVAVPLNYLEQVLDNLLDNAIKFSPNGGDLTVSADLADAAGRPAAKGDWVALTVADHGIGIPADELTNVFEYFYQVDSGTTRRFEGTGIGLALCRAIVDANGGRIWAESPGPGQGSAFHVLLPILQSTRSLR